MTKAKAPDSLPLSVTYRKTLSFGQFNSHCTEATMTVPLASEDQFEAEFRRLYRKLQTEVDAELQKVGFYPDRSVYGKPEPMPPVVPPVIEKWTCSFGQRILIKNLIETTKTPSKEVQRLAKKLHGVGVQELNKEQADLFIQELEGRVGKTVEVISVVKE